jgi:ring-1,2-phenylacetyl-CoA epoxidase subunit PaaE
MSNHSFYTLTISDIRRETPDCVSIAFAIPSDLVQIFSFTQGQYLTLKTTLRGAEVRRSYSICSAVDDKELRVAVKKVEGGIFSTFANESLSIGDALEVMPPMGRFFVPLDASTSKNYVGYASGSGITPIYSILKTTLEREPSATFTLFYGNKNTSSVIFKEQIEALKNKYMNRFRVYYILSREFNDSPLFSGRIDAEKCEAFSKYFVDNQYISAFFLCGPEEMIFSVTDKLLELGVDKKKIHFELFTTSKTTVIKTESKKVEAVGAMSQISLRLDGKMMHFPLSASGVSILDAALALGADLPFACKGGVCCTCKARILEGEVKMEVNYGLEDDEVAANYVLSCQAHPISEKVVIDFDV